jgi:serine/threonine-protein kinase
MATFEKPKPTNPVPLDLLPVIRASGVLSDRQFNEIRGKVLRGDLPNTSLELAARLVKEKVLTEYQARRFLSNKSHGLIVGRYVILDRIGSGSMGRVYKAHHLMMDRYVALKIIAPEIVTNEKVVARFQREMKLVGRLDHPNVIRAFDADQLGKVLYIVMEFAQGQSLGQILRKGRIPPLEMADYGGQAALGLGHAHNQGIVHRDVKPSNLLLTDDKQVKVLDLGLGVLMEADTSATFATADGIAVGTVDYMSPEQACGREVDGRSDLYSLGCAMYHLISGKLPFPGESPIERMGKRIGGKHVPILDVRPDVPPSLVRVLERLLAPRPQDRFQNALEAAEALRSVARPVLKPAVSTPPKASGESAREGFAPPDTPQESPANAALWVEPEYPRWFRPLAVLAESRPVAALTSVLLTLGVTFAFGVVAGWLLRRG